MSLFYEEPNIIGILLDGHTPMVGITDDGHQIRLGLAVGAEYFYNLS